MRKDRYKNGDIAQKGDDGSYEAHPRAFANTDPVENTEQHQHPKRYPQSDRV